MGCTCSYILAKTTLKLQNLNFKVFCSTDDYEVYLQGVRALELHTHQIITVLNRVDSESNVCFKWNTRAT